MIRHLLLAGVFLLAAVLPAAAAVGLTTVPERDVVRMTIYNAVDLTLVQEARTLVLKKGLNRIQYQWAGTLIDTTSVELRALEKAADVEVLGVVYPPNSPATLVWEIESKAEGQAMFEISYFTSGLSWSADYVLRAAPDEATGDVDGWVAVTNSSGENYPRAEVRLVVGSINLVEQIRDLATGQLRERTRELDKKALKDSGKAIMAENASGTVGKQMQGILDREGIEGAIEVVSARLGDYHIFTVSGVQSMMGGATTRFQAITAKKPMALEVLYRIGFMSDHAQKLYRFINDEEHQLPDGPLPDGQWHVFRITDAKSRALSYSGSTTSSYVPPKQKVELNLGTDPGIAVKQVHEWHSETGHHYDVNGRVDGWTMHDHYRFTLVNTKPFPVSIEYMVATGGGEWTIDGLIGERRDQDTYRHQATVDPGKLLELGPFTISTSQGDLAKPNRPPGLQPLPKIEAAK